MRRGGDGVSRAKVLGALARAVTGSAERAAPEAAPAARSALADAARSPVRSDERVLIDSVTGDVQRFINTNMGYFRSPDEVAERFRTYSGLPRIADPETRAIADDPEAMRMIQRLVIEQEPYAPGRAMPEPLAPVYGSLERRVAEILRRGAEPEELAPVAERATRSIMPAPQRFFDPADRAYKPFLQDFEPQPGGRYLEMRRGEAPRDVTGERVGAARIAVGPDGRPSMLVGDPTDLPTGSPGKGSTTTKTNLFKRSAGWDWTEAPEGYADVPTLVSVENRGKHYYALSAEFPKGVDLARYADAPSEPRLRPTTQGNVNLGQRVGTIKVRGKEHPVYDLVTVRSMAPIGGLAAAAAAEGEDEEPEGYAAGGRILSAVSRALTREAPEASAGVRAYHGSPHDFDSFRMDKIGTGEGNQSYGHGLYFAENEGVARSYRDALAPLGTRAARHNTDAAGTAARLLDEGLTPDQAIEELQLRLGLPHISEGLAAGDPVVLDFVRKANEAQELLRRPNGRMYEVELGVDPNRLLDWDAPLREQSPKVREFFGQRGADENFMSPSGRTQSGGDIYFETARKNPSGRSGRYHANREDIRELSADMAASGIPGIRYLDEGSRAPAAMAPSQARQLRAGIADVDRQVAELREEIAANRSTPGLTGQFFARREADLRALDERRANLQRQLDDVEAGNNLSRNYVIFDERLIRIVRKYGIAGLAAALGVSYPEAAALAAEQGIEDDMPAFAMGGQVDANEMDPNYAGDEGITATERSLEGIAQPQRLAAGGQARGGPRRPAPTAEERAALYTRLEQQYDLPEGYLARVRAIESSDGTRLFNRNSRAAGPFQFIPRTATAMGLRDPYDEIASAEAAARLAADNARALRRRGFEVDAPTLYLAHQQGATGAVSLLQGNRPAVDIVGRNAVLLNAGNENMTGPEFAGRVLDYFRGNQPQPAAAAPAQVAAPAEPPAIPRIGALPPVQASAQPAAQPVAQQQPAAPAAQAPTPIPLPPPPAPPVPAARQRRADDPSVMRDVIAGLEMQGSGAAQPSPIERHLQMVQQGQRRYATAMPEQEPTMMAQGGLARTLGAMGRGNDTLVAHITPREALMLAAMGGSGTTNPYTGMLEFDDGGGDGGGGDGGGGDSGGGEGGGADSGGGGEEGGGYGDGSGFADGQSYGAGPDAAFGGMADDGFGGGPTGSFGGGPPGSFGAPDGLGEGWGDVDWGAALDAAPEAPSATSMLSSAFPGLSAMGRIGSAVMRGEDPPDLTEQEGFGLVNSMIGGPVGMLGMGLTGLATAAFGPPTGPAGEGLNNANGNEMGDPNPPSVGFNLLPDPVQTTSAPTPVPQPAPVPGTRGFSPLSGDPTRYGFGAERSFYTPGFAEGGLARARGRRTLRDEMRDIEAEVRGERPASAGVTIARGFGEGLGGIVSPATARAIQMTTRLPQDARFLQAVENTPGARITDDGLQLELLRYQKPQQAGAQAIREGVFYLPATLPSRSVGTYRAPDTSGYGGSEMIRGETLLRAPLAVPGNTGGTVPERAFRELTSDRALQRLISETRATANAPLRGGDYYRNVEDFLEKFGGNPELATELVNNSRGGNRMRYALQEHIIGNQARLDGYDSIVGTGARKPRISEVFDLREAAYPVPGAPEFEMLVPHFDLMLR